MSPSKSKNSSSEKDVKLPDLTPYVPRLLIEWQIEHPDSPYLRVDGSLVFVDISGFTKLSERLAARGKVGAEELTDAINTVFGELLGVAWKAGGGLLKFGGDALLLFFYGHEHEARACHSAAGMKRALRTCGRIETGAGIIRLQMSIGIEAGRFDFYLTGEDHEELVITGPMTSQTVVTEGEARTGEILVGPAVAERVADPVFESADGSRGYLLKRSPEIPTWGVEPSLPDTGVDLSRFIPDQIRSQILPTHAEGEHRKATVGFIHFGGSDEILRSDGPDAVRTHLNSIVTAAQKAAAEFDVCFLGSDIAVDGGKIILVSGAPLAHANHEERMLRTVRAIADTRTDLSIKIGVAHGHVFAGEVGPPFRKTYTVMGNTVNLAARLMQHAQPGQILTLDTVLDRSNTNFISSETEPLKLKGFTKPVVARSVEAIVSGSANGDDDDLPMAGREEELRVLLDVLEQAAAGNTRLIEIIGEAGLGKSRLLSELRAQAKSAAYFTAASEQYESSTAFYCFRRILRNLIGIGPDDRSAEAAKVFRNRVAELTPDLVPWLPLIATVVDIYVPSTKECNELEDKFRLPKLHYVVTEFLKRTQTDPAVFAFEDIHWIDEASRELLAFMLEFAPSQSWLICTTRRPDSHGLKDSSKVPVTELRLQPLANEAAAALATSATDVALPQHTIDTLTRRAGGHPLFLRELVNACLDAGGNLETLPDSVESVIAARIDRLSHNDRDLLRLASVLGWRFEPGLLLGNLTEELGTLDDQAVERLSEFIDTSNPVMFQFRQALFRDAAYESLSFKRRRQLHSRVADELETSRSDHTEEIAELLSLHFHRADRFDRSWEYSRTAANKAKTKYANIEAAEFYHRALEAGKKVDGVSHDDLAAVAEALGDVAEIAARYEEAKKAFAEARKLTVNDDIADSRLLWKEGVLSERLGKYTDALKWYGRGMRIARGASQKKKSLSNLVQLGLAYAGVRYRQGNYQDCVKLCKEVISNAKSIGHNSGLAHAYYLIDAALTDLNDPEAAKYDGLSLPIYEELGDFVGQANALNNLGINAYYRGRWNESLEYYRRSHEARERAGDFMGAATAANNIGETLSDQGRLKEAEEQFNEALRVFTAAKYPVGIAIVTSNLGRAAARAGRKENASTLLESALNLFTEIEADTFVLETQARIAENHILGGDPVSHAKTLDESIEGVRSVGGMTSVLSMLERLRAFAHMQSGNPAAAIVELEKSLASAKAGEAEYEMALTLQAFTRFAASGAIEADPSHAVDSQKILDRLNVTATPNIPLTAQS